MISILFSLAAWLLDLIGDVLGQFVLKRNYFLFIALGIGFAAGLSPLVYILGSGDCFSKSNQSQETVVSKKPKRGEEIEMEKIDKRNPFEEGALILYVQICILNT